MTEQELAGMIWSIKEIGYTPLRDTSEILADLMALEADTTTALKSLISEAK